MISIAHELPTLIDWDPFTAQVVFSIYILSSRIVTNLTIDVWGTGEPSLRRFEYKNTRSMQLVSKFTKNDLLYLKTKICMNHMSRLGQAIKTNLNALVFFLWMGGTKLSKIFFCPKSLRIWMIEF